MIQTKIIKRWTLHDELIFIRRLVRPYKTDGKCRSMMPCLCDEYRLDKRQTVTGYIASLHLRKKWDFEMNERKYLKLINLAKEVLRETEF